VYAEQVRSVFALAAPGLPSGRVDAPVSLTALPATVIDLLDEQPVASFTEPSLLGCIAARENCPTVAVSQMLLFGAWVGYTFERHRLLVDPLHGIERLYDSEKDPLEQRDLAATEPALIQKLRARAREFDRAHCVSDID
jgi:arylsulfatase A-like enzyme